jgi:effector-binding domain-containing protein
MQISDMLETRIAMTEKGRDVDLPSIVLMECEAMPILLGPELPADSNVSRGWYYLVDFYKYCRENNIILGLPMGTIISHADLIRGNLMRPSRYYYRPVCEGSYPSNAQKPRGLYVIGHEHTECCMVSNLYTRLFNYVREAGLTICGNAYEEFLLDETSITDPTKYLLQIAIHVQK